MRFVVTNHATDLNCPVYAENINEALYKAYTTYGIDAVGCNISGDNGDFICTVVRKCWDEVLERYFNDFTIEDVLNHLIVTTYAWINFNHEITHGYDRDGEYTSERVNAAGMEYMRNHDPLGNKMDAIGFAW